MANAYRNESTLEVSGETYTLRANWGAMAELEDALGVADLSALQRRISKISFADLRKALIAMARAGGREIPEADINALELDDLNRVVEAITAAMTGPADEKKNAPQVEIVPANGKAAGAKRTGARRTSAHS